MAERPVSELVRHCRAQDPKAWTVLIERYRALVWSVPLRLGLGQDLASEVFQDVFESLLRNLDALEDPERLASWLYTAARRVSLRRISALRRKGLHEGSERSLLNLSSTEPPLSEALVDAERRVEVLRLVEALPERCRRLLTALFLDEREPDYDQIAESLGIPRGSIGPSRLRCLKKLYESMKASGYPFGPR
jgi:RNA polymerase sigma factor (sigma-70 family)